MATLEPIGTNSKALLYTDDNGVSIRFVVAHIVDYADAGNGMLKIDRVTGGVKMKLDNQNAVNAALTLLDGFF